MKYTGAIFQTKKRFVFQLAWGTSNHDVIKKFEQILLCHELLDLWSDFYRKRTWFASFLCWLMWGVGSSVIWILSKRDMYDQRN